ncbi:hypothetical protein [Eggerthella lenta]|uniref:hypothetical protein n=1 Tax=Eggerthella lenta TaxID=84112 RepID=UPI0022E0421E|nr:hypothetical protein [Eggerthella lenta]
MIDLETLAASCATMADEIVARGSSDTFRYDADGVLEFGDNPEYYSPLSSAVTRSAFPETAREYGYTREYLEQAERRLLACVIGYCALDGELASIRDGGEDRDGFRVNPLDVHEVLLCARTAPSDPRGCAALAGAIKGNRYVDGEESYLDRAMAHMDYNYAKLDGFLAMFPPARSEQGPIADRVLDSASMRLKTFFALSMPMADAAAGLPGDEAEGGKHYHRAAAPDDGGRAAEEE